jgi:hypothetical protein
MKTRQRKFVESFEQRLVRNLKTADFAEAAQEVDAALDELTSGALCRVAATPDGPWLYEDPVLESVLELGEVIASSNIGFAAEGQDLDNNIWRWRSLIVPFIRGRFARTWDVLSGRVPENDLVVTSLPLRIAIFGDGGYFGLAQRKIFGMIRRRHNQAPFHSVIHLGDTYRGGREAEMFRHLLVPMLSLKHELNVGAFSLCGNHDIYAGPDGYLGVLDGLAQPGRYFALEAPGWRIGCLDSTLADRTFKRHNGKLDAKQLQWIAEKQRSDSKQLIVLTHHVPRSAWDNPSTDLIAGLATLPRLSAWYWGHEHRAVAYKKRSEDDFVGGCVGHGVFLEPWSDPRGLTDDIEWYPDQSRCTCYDSRGQRYWPHGFLELEINESGVHETWHTEGTRSWKRSFS